MWSAAVVTAVALTLTACGGSSDSGNGGSGGGAGSTTEIEVMVPSYGDKTKPYWEDLAKAFEAKNSNIKVKLEVQSWDDIQKVVDTRIQGDKAPDILELDAAGPAYGKEGLLFKAEEIVSDATLKDIVPVFLDGGKIDGTNYGVPTVASTRALFYNKDLFAKAGIAAPPKTWDELLDASKKISALGDGTYGYGMPLGSEEGFAEASIWAFGAGGSWEKDGKITVDTAEANAGLSFAKKMIDEKATQPDPGATNRTPLMNVFIQGKIGMIEGLPPVVGQVKTKNPSLNWGIAPSPSKDDKAFTLGVADYFVAFKKDGSKQEAVRKFLDFFYESANYVKFNDNEGFIPATKSGGAAAAAKPELKSFIESLPGAKFYPSQNAAWSATKGGFATLVGQIQTKPAADVLKEIQAKADAG